MYHTHTKASTEKYSIEEANFTLDNSNKSNIHKNNANVKKNSEVMSHIKFIYVPDDTTRGLHDNKKRRYFPLQNLYIIPHFLL